MKIGDMRERITLQTKQVTRNGIGDEVVTWADVATVWAEVKPIRGREYFAGAQMQQTVDVRAVIRTYPGITADMRFVWGGQPYDLVSPPIPGIGSWRGTLELMAVSGVRNGR